MNSLNDAYSSGPAYPIKEDYYKPVVRTESEGNYVHTRPRTSRGRNRWTLKWEYIDDTDYQNLKGFFDENQGSAFSWTNPIDSTTYTVMFSDDTFKGEAVSPGYWNVELNIEEL